MSSGQYNFLRCCSVHTCLFPKILRFIVENEIPPDELRKRANFVKLFNQKLKDTATVDLDKCDYTSLYALMMAAPVLKKTSRSNVIPILDYVERMQTFRHRVYSHVDTAVISDIEFNKYWKIVQDISSDMDNQFSTSVFRSLLIELRNCEITVEVTEAYIDSMKKKIKEDSGLLDQIDGLAGTSKIRIDRVRNVLLYERVSICP